MPTIPINVLEREATDMARQILDVGLRGRISYEVMDTIYRSAFDKADGSALKDFVSILRAYDKGDEQSLAKANKALGKFNGGHSPELSHFQLTVLQLFFIESIYSKPIRPTAQDAKMLRVWHRLFFPPNGEPRHAKLKDLQDAVREFWSEGGSAKEARVREVLASIDDKIDWDATHIFAFAWLLFIEGSFKSITPYDKPGSWW